VSSAAAASIPAAASATAPNPSLQPYKLFTIQDNVGSHQAWISAGTTAAIDAVNDSGGVNGHKVELTTCPTNNDPNVSAQCARQAVADKDVVAVVADSTSYTANVDPVLAAAGLPLIGGNPFSAGDFTSPIAFNANPGALGTPAEGLVVIQQLHGTKIGVPYVDVPAGAGIKPLTEAITGPLGGKVVGSVPIPLTATNVTTQVAAVAAAKPDGIIDALLTPQFVEVVKAYRQQGGTAPFVTGANEVSAQVIQSQLAGLNSNMYGIAWYNYTSPGYQQYLAEMKKYQPAALKDNPDLMTSAWQSIHMFAQAAEKTNAASSGAALTRSALLNTMNTWSDFNLGDMTPTIDFSKPQSALGGTFSRIVAPYYYPVQYKDGGWVSLNNWQALDLFTGKAAS
jgi:ABC-type branched-subunit amino acid transport system substrate-binding protein